MLSHERGRLADNPHRLNNTCAASRQLERNFVLLPYAGGSVDSLRSLRRPLNAGGQVTLLSYPRFQAGVAEMAEYISARIMDIPPPLVLFGHSLGGLVAFEVAMRLDQSRRVEHLFISGCAAPNSSAFRNLHSCEDTDELCVYLERSGGITPSSGKIGHARTQLQHDLAGLLAYCPLLKPVSCPITCLAGQHDAVAPAAAMAGWHSLSQLPGRTHVVPGGHFFFSDRSRQIATIMLDTLDASEVMS